MSTPATDFREHDEGTGEAGEDPRSAALVPGDLQLVGLVFDGNIKTFAWDSVFTEVGGRSVAVHAAAILEVLRKVCGMSALAEELDEARTK